MEFETDYYGIGVCYGDRAVHIRTDAALRCFLDRSKRDALELARHVKARYAEIKGRCLDITDDSMAVEILIHVYVDELARGADTFAEKLPGPLKKLLLGLDGRVESSTEVIDSGESEVDGNRAVFDALAAFHEAVYALLE